MLLGLERPVLVSSIRLYKVERLLTSCKVVLDFVTSVIVLPRTVSNIIQCVERTIHSENRVK
jgi:hypothetical protein